jgi:OmpA-OmpF porin, OOP family
MWFRWLLVSCLAISIALVMSPRPAAAQERPAIDTRTWRSSTDPNASLVLEPAVTPGPGVFTVGAYSHYSFHPISLRRGNTDDVALRPLEHVLGIDAIANIGIGQRLALGAVAPVIVYQDGSKPLPKTVSESSSVPSFGFGDLGFTAKGALIRNERGGFGLAALGYVSLPTGDRTSFAGEAGPTASARLLAEYTLLVAVAQASLGYKFRTDHRTWPAAEVGGVRFGDEIPWSVAIALRPGVFGIDPGNRQRLEVGFHGWLPAGPVGPFGSGNPGSAALSPVLAAVSDRIELGHYRDTFLTIGGEIGITQAVGVPAFRAIVGIGWTPRSHDMDGDGVKDDVDGCPEIPEDKDGFEDNDGCPEIDNDDDGIIDREDACPNVKGSPSSDPKKNGCPLPDADGDGVEDAVDMCPKEKGSPSKDPKRNGCPAQDADGDGVDDSVDKCPNQPEDRDGFQDNDGCPDPDNDGDGIADKEDACPDAAGEPSTDSAKNGCPNPDRDGDTFDNGVDKCPDSAEVFNGIDDDDGCPDEGGKPLVVIDDKRKVRLAKPLKLSGTAEPEVDPASLPTLRALALELNRHRDWTLAIGARPVPGPNADLDALNRAFAVVRVLAGLSRRDGLAETVGWDAVKYDADAASSVAFRILVAPSVKP